MHKQMLTQTKSRNPLEQQKKVRLMIEKLVRNKHLINEFLEHQRNIKSKKIRQHIKDMNMNYLKDNREDSEVWADL
jgi:hypothetical protein